MANFKSLNLIKVLKSNYDKVITEFGNLTKGVVDIKTTKEYQEYN